MKTRIRTLTVADAVGTAERLLRLDRALDHFALTVWVDRTNRCAVILDRRTNRDIHRWGRWFVQKRVEQYGALPLGSHIRIPHYESLIGHDQLSLFYVQLDAARRILEELAGVSGIAPRADLGGNRSSFQKPRATSAFVLVKGSRFVTPWCIT